MLLSTFQHLKGIGPKREQELWRSGILSWDDLELRQEKQLWLFRSEDKLLRLSRKALKEEDTEFFANHLPSREYYRIASTFPSKTIFLDIETTGLSRYYDTITIVGWSMGTSYRVSVKGNKDNTLRKAFSEAKAIITFNGSLFDLPFLRQEFQDLKIPTAHIDLRFLAQRIGLSGGQKKVENLLGIKRPAHVVDLAGEKAPLLWYKYRRGDLDSLKLLISYNHADVEGMKLIFDAIIDRLMKKQQVPPPVRPFHRFSENLSKLEWSTKKVYTPNNGIYLHPYRGKFGPTISLRRLSSTLDLSHLRVIGIDLTGSETRPSGWCLLETDYACTQRLKSDVDIIQATLDAKPTLVSIDSPLSLPNGRTTVSDDDPGREAYGITRYCERKLRGRGINIYPCLIKSMQNLTARGIRLAKYFRSIGIPVIESYPGVAQDIMNIPRKRASLELLESGLAEFGIKGKFLEHRVSHDELDAITSAVVGLFFWSGRFEALGNDNEEYLIIPDTKTIPNTWIERIVIGLSGPIAAGKTTAGEFLRSHGCHYDRFSLVLEDILCNRGTEPNREDFQKFGEEVNKHPGQRWLCRTLARRLPSHGDLVIDGLRFPDDHAFLVETFGPAFLHVYIDAPKEVRQKRYISTGGTPEEFAHATCHPVEANVAKLASLAHIVVDNAGDLESFISKIIRVENYRKKPKRKSLVCQ